jgi:hypothetical protein
MPYDRYMEAEGVPVFRGIGVKRVQDLPMAPRKRLGGRGSYTPNSFSVVRMMTVLSPRPDVAAAHSSFSAAAASSTAAPFINR